MASHLENISLLILCICLFNVPFTGIFERIRGVIIQSRSYISLSHYLAVTLLEMEVIGRLQYKVLTFSI